MNQFFRNQFGLCYFALSKMVKEQSWQFWIPSLSFFLLSSNQKVFVFEKPWTLKNEYYMATVYLIPSLNTMVVVFKINNGLESFIKYHIFFIPIHFQYFMNVLFDMWNFWTLLKILYLRKKSTFNLVLYLLG